MIKDRDRERGFTLIEMIVVLVVLGLVLGLVIAHGPVRSRRLEIDAAARHLAGALRVARSRAIAEGRVALVRLGSGGYRLDGETPIVLPPDILLAGDSTIRFTPDGGSSGAQILLRDGDKRITISVDWLIGRVRLSEGG
jgi:general secretion pathway protein H